MQTVKKFGDRNSPKTVLFFSTIPNFAFLIFEPSKSLLMSCDDSWNIHPSYWYIFKPWNSVRASSRNRLFFGFWRKNRRIFIAKKREIVIHSRKRSESLLFPLCSSFGREGNNRSRICKLLAVFHSDLHLKVKTYLSTLQKTTLYFFPKWYAVSLKNVYW